MDGAVRSDRSFRVEKGLCDDLLECQQEISKTAERCPHCEAETEPAPTGEERVAVTKALADEGPELMAELRNVFEKSSGGEDFVNRVMIGDCSKCDSSQTGDCEHEPEIDDVCVARCFIADSYGSVTKANTHRSSSNYEVIFASRQCLPKGWLDGFARQPGCDTRPRFGFDLLCEVESDRTHGIRTVPRRHG